MDRKTETAVFGGGCFWCTEAVFCELKGVIKVTPGYAGGRTGKPTYLQVCSGTTGHVEAAMIEYEPELVSYNDLLEVFFYTHDPTTTNRQGNDAGEQYHSTIFYLNPGQKDLAAKFIDKLNAGNEFGAPVVTTLKPLVQFYEAEDYNRGYYRNNAGQPYCRTVITPKLVKFRARFKHAAK